VIEVTEVIDVRGFLLQNSRCKGMCINTTRCERIGASWIPWFSHEFELADGPQRIIL